MTIFTREMKAHRKSLLLWCLGIFFMVVAGMGKYSYYYESGQSVNELVSTIPKSLRAILGFGDFDLSKASGFYGMLFLYLLVMATIHATMLGAEIIAKEERDKTTEFLLVKPVSRSQIITSKLLAGMANISILNIVTLVLSIAIVGQYSHGEAITNEIVTLMVGMFILQTMFLFIGTGIASMSKKPKISASIATSVLLLTFILSIIIDMNNKLTGLKYLTPFKYFETADLIYSKQLDTLYVVLSSVIITVFLVMTYVFFNKRDMNV